MVLKVFKPCKHWENCKYETRGCSVKMNSITTGQGKLCLQHADSNNYPKGSPPQFALILLPGYTAAWLYRRLFSSVGGAPDCCAGG